MSNYIGTIFLMIGESGGGVKHYQHPIRSRCCLFGVVRGWGCGLSRKESLIGWAGWKCRKVGPHRAAIGSPVGGGGVRGGIRGGGGSRDGSEREEGARPPEPPGVGAAATSVAALGWLFWAHPPTGADGESRRAADWEGGRSVVSKKPRVWSGLVLPPPRLTWDGAVRRPPPPGPEWSRPRSPFSPLVAQPGWQC